MRRSGRQDARRASRISADFAPALRSGRANARISGAGRTQRDAHSICPEPAPSTRNQSRRDRDLLAAYPRPRRLVLIGGPTLYWQLPVDQIVDALRPAARCGEAEGGSVIAVGAREAPPNCLQLRRATLESSKVPVPVRAATKVRPPIRRMIEAADEIYVTADSVAMVADAVNTRQAGRNRANREKCPRASGHGNHGHDAPRQATSSTRPALLLGIACGAWDWRNGRLDRARPIHPISPPRSRAGSGGF